MYDFTMPSMGADMTSATLVAWNVSPGDALKKGDIICEIETEKGNIDVEVWEPGVVVELLIQPGEKVPVGEPIARLEGSGAAAVVEAAPTPAPPVTPVVPPSPAAEAPVNQVHVPSSRDGQSASPAARRRAAELGIDLADVQGSGPGGIVKLSDLEGHDATVPAHEPGHHRVTPVARKMAAAAGLDTDKLTASGVHDTVTKADVERALRPDANEPEDDSYSSLRRAIARAMAKSKREIPHYYLSYSVDVTTAVDWLSGFNADRPVKDRALFGGLLVRAVGLAARDVPEMNGFYADDQFRPSAPVHVGFAVAMRGGGVVAPAIHDADSRSLEELMEDIKDVVRRVRRGKLRSSEMTDPTITLTSLGELGVDSVIGIIYPPQVAIVGAGSPREQAIAHNGMVGVRTVVELTLAGDHRVSDGMAGSKFLRAISNYLQQPENLL